MSDTRSDIRKAQVIEIIKSALEELNERLDEGKKLTYSEDIRLIGSGASICSLDFIAFIAAIEELAAEKLGKDIHIVSDRAFSMERSPFQNIGTLTEFVAELVE